MQCASAMSSGVESKKSEVAELRALLRNPEVQRDSKRYLQAVQKVIACMTLGINVSKLFSEMIMAGATHDLVQKKLVYLYLSNYAESNSELALLTVNTLQKDCQDRNPMVRGLALRAMCSLGPKKVKVEKIASALLNCKEGRVANQLWLNPEMRPWVMVPNILEYIREPLRTGLGDRSGYVRKTAVMGILKLFYVAPDFVREQNFVDILYQLLRDRDPQVVSNSISALDEILASEGGMVVNTKISLYLLGRLREFNEWGQCQVLDLLLRYTPPSEEQLFDILNVLDDRLKHANSGVVLGATRLFLHFTQDMPDLHQDVYERIHTPLLTLLGSSSSELAYTCLQHIQLLLARQPDLWSKDYHNFYCRYNDPPYLKVKKLELLTEVCTTDNARNIVDELGEYATDVNSLVAKKAIQAIGQIALRLTVRADICVDKLLSLLGMDIDYVTSETLVSMTNILRKFDNMVEVIVPKLPTSLENVTDPEGRTALLWILGEYGESLSNTPYVLEELVDNISEESSSTVKLQLLSAVMKMFFKRPPECQEMLGRLLEHSIDEDGDMDVHDRGMLYYRLLKQDVKQAQKIVCGQAHLVAEKNTIIPRLSLFPEFNTLSVMYGIVSTNFVTQECPYTRGEPTAGKGAESNFEMISDTPISSPSPSHSDSTPRASGISSVNTMGIPSAPIPGTPPSILLNPKPTMTAGDFEQKWIKMDTVCERVFQLDRIPPPKELERVLAARFVMTMASSSHDQPAIKYFFYGQNVSTLHLFLMEVNVSVNDSSLSFNLKCEKPSQAQDFVKHFLQTLVANGWLSRH